MKTTVPISVLLVSLACSVLLCHAQKNYTLNGHVLDSATKKPLSDAEVFLYGQVNKAYTNDQGYFFLTVSCFNCEAEIRHLSYKTVKTRISVSDDTTIIYLPAKPVNLNPVDITVSKPEEVIPGKAYHVMDYEISGDNIVLLAFENQSFLKPKLLLVSFLGDTLTNIPVNKPVGLCKDFDGKIYFISKTTAYEIMIDSEKLMLANPINIEKFNSINNVIVGHAGEHYYLRQYMYEDQVLNYYNYFEPDDSLNCFRTLADHDNIQRNRWGVYFDGKEEDLRFQQLVINRPLYAPLINLNDTLILFNFLESKLEKFSIDADKISETGITFQLGRNYVRELYIDVAMQKVYILFRKNGISQLKEISTGNGAIVLSIEIPGFVFIEKIKVNEGYLYFLYRQKDLAEYKKLYKMKI
ncbi:MAG: carboxypeptidase-like regulatory domain-containing protein [Bacteroidales bacterium]|jgi:hypothetical protein|nr:carboxypeptidase-like regulatory domain-containing protein [Bacteroidales bacterium]MDD4213943.1 carboxypeptidase-like regulatory domain-containing protein [Bacteroidales bacterium]